MRKFYLSLIILFFLIISHPFVVHAEYLPPTLPDLNSVNLPVFLEQAAQMTMVNQQGVTLPEGGLNRVNQIVNGRTIAESMQNHYVDNANLGELQLFYDSEGNLIPQNNTYTVVGTSDVINYCYVAAKDTGEILCTYDEYNELISTISAGNTSLSGFLNNNPVNGIDSINREIDYIKDNTMIVFSRELTDTEKESLAGYEFTLTYKSNYLGYTVFVPNACTSNTVVTPYRVNNVYSYHGEVEPNSQMSQFTPIIRTNNPGEVFYSSEGSSNYLLQENNSVYGYTFNYISAVNVGYAPLWNGGYLDMNLPTESEYRQMRVLSDYAVYAQPAENEGEVTNVYNYSYVTNNTVPKPSPTINNDYTTNNETNYYNYPVENYVTYPDYSSTTTNYYDTIYNYYTSPNDDISLGTLDPNELTDNIPILSNLKYRFPFSIPFDLYNLFKSFSVPRETPVFSGELAFGHYYTWEYNLDLSPFNDIAELVRTLTLIGFIIGLAYFSYTHFFGS